MLRRIQYNIPRQCLETLYKSFIRPILEYGDIIFDGSPKIYLDELEHIQRECAIICTGAYRHTSHERLLQELGWEPLSARRTNHRLTVMYKIRNGLTPDYLIQLCPDQIQNLITYNLRNRENLAQLVGRTNTYLNSFFPKTVRDWNEINNDLRNSVSLQTFKYNLKRTTMYKRQKLFSFGDREGRVNHTRLRLGLSALNKHRSNYHFIDNSKCTKCSHLSEDTTHYFLECPAYDPERILLLTNIASVLSPGVHFSLLYENNVNDKHLFVNSLLNGFINLTFNENKTVFQFIHEFICVTERFKY